MDTRDRVEPAEPRLASMIDLGLGRDIGPDCCASDCFLVSVGENPWSDSDSDSAAGSKGGRSGG